MGDVVSSPSIVLATDADYAWLLGLGAPRDDLTIAEGGVADRVVIAHIRDIAARQEAEGCPGSWLIVTGREIVGLCGYHAAPRAREVEIGYNVAPTRERRGYATRGIALLIEQAAERDEVDTIVAHTAPDNVASQRVLERNGFERAGEGVSHGEPVIRWTRSLRRGSFDAMTGAVPARQPTSHERLSGRPWDASYTDGPAPWNIGAPQPAIVRLVDSTRLEGPVLDAGCGGGENALLIASRGLPVLGFDVAETALAQARVDASGRGLDVDFVTADALSLGDLGRTFATVIDSGLLHTFDANERRTYARSLAGVIDPRGALYVLAFSDRGERTGPHPLRESDFEDAFNAGSGWKVISVEADRVMTRYHDAHGAPAWFATIARL